MKPLEVIGENHMSRAWRLEECGASGLGLHLERAYDFADISFDVGGTSLPTLLKYIPWRLPRRFRYREISQCLGVSFIYSPPTSVSLQPHRRPENKQPLHSQVMQHVLLASSKNTPGPPGGPTVTKSLLGFLMILRFEPLASGLRVGRFGYPWRRIGVASPLHQLAPTVEVVGAK